MNEKLSCGIVRDLMPSYVDGIASPESERAVEEHVAECGECKKALENMKNPERREESPEKEINFFKRLKADSLKKALLGFFVAIGIVLSAVFLKTFFVGNALLGDGFSLEMNAEGKIEASRELLLSVKSTDDGEYLSKIKTQEKNGTLYLTVYSVPQSVTGKRERKISYIPENDITAVKVNNETVWENGYFNTSTEKRLFELKTPYCGDITANLKIAQVLGIYDELGPFTNELSTVERPFEWRLFLKNEVKEKEEAHFKKRMKSYGFALLATIENLDRVTFVYRVNGEEKRLTLTSEQATKETGKDIKTCCGSVAATRGLLDFLSIV